MTVTIPPNWTCSYYFDICLFSQLFIFISLNFNDMGRISDSTLHTKITKKDGCNLRDCDIVSGKATHIYLNFENDHNRYFHGDKKLT